MINEQSEENLKIYKAFAADFAKLVVTQEWHGAYSMLAPWLKLQMSPDDLRKAFEKELWEMNGYWELEELIYPAEFSVSWNSSTPQSLKEPMSWRESRKFSEELNDENFRQWLVIQFLPAEDDERIEFDAWFDFWLAIVEINGELKIGYYEFTEAD